MNKKPKEGDLRVWLNRNGQSEYITVGSQAEAKTIIRKAIKKDLKDYSISFNAFGLERFEDKEWGEWYSRDGEDIMEVIDNEEMEAEAKKNLSENQKMFIEDAEEQGFKVDYTYSGRGMYGKTCPSIIEERDGDRFGTKARTSSDNMGRDTVIYCPR